MSSLVPQSLTLGATTSNDGREATEISDGDTTARAQPEEALADFQLRERSLLYVVETRARDRLVVTYAGEGSELLRNNRSISGELHHDL